MEYSYRIFEEVYNDMLLGKKTIEFRLLNEKSNNIQIGDYIKFIVQDNEEKYLITEEDFIQAFNNIFGKNKVRKSKIVGFKIKSKS